MFVKKVAHVRKFAQRLKVNGTPIVEPDQDPRFAKFTFVYIGEAPHGVALQLNKVSDPLDIEDTLLERIERTEIFALTLRLPANWQGSYTYTRLPHRMPPRLHEGPDRETRAILAQNAMTDPWARELLPAKSLEPAADAEPPRHAVARGPQSPTMQLWHHESPVTERLADVRSPINGEPLPLYRWSSPNATEHSPVVLLTDDEVWRSQYPVAAEISRRVQCSEMEPVHLLFLESGGSRQRSLDYTAPAEATRSLLTAVRDSARDHVPDVPLILVGQSFGALLAMNCAARHPDLVRAAVAQSPSLWWPGADSPWNERPASWFEEQAASSHPGAPVLREVGKLEAVLTVPVRSAAALLQSRGALLAAHEHPGGHDVLAWQASIVDVLTEALTATDAGFLRAVSRQSSRGHLRAIS